MESMSSTEIRGKKFTAGKRKQDKNRQIRAKECERGARAKE